MSVFNTALISLTVFFISNLASAECYERFYTKDHLVKNKNQQLQSVQFSWSYTYVGDNPVYPFELTVHLKQDGKNKVGSVHGTCDAQPVNTIWNSSDKLEKVVNCQFADQKGSLTLNPYNPKFMLGVLSADSTFKDLTYGAPSDGTLKVPEWDLKFGMDYQYNRGYLKCEEPVQMVYQYTTPRLWNEVILFSIRNDLARPTVTARNLFHLSTLLWDVYASFDSSLKAYEQSHSVSVPKGEVKKARNEAINYAAYYFIKHRYDQAPGNVANVYPDVESGDEDPDNLINNMLDRVMQKLQLTTDLKRAKKNSPMAAFGLQMAEKMLADHRNDGSREPENYAAIPGALKSPNKDLFLDYTQSGIKIPYTEKYNEETKEYDVSGGEDVASLMDINYWIPLYVPGAADQGGNEQEARQAPLTLFWGRVPTFGNLEPYKSQDKPGVYFDPGKHLPSFEKNRAEFIKENLKVVELSALLNPVNVESMGKDFDGDGQIDKNIGAEDMDISPLSWGNNPLGTNDGVGRKVNPVTGEAYKPHKVKKADFYRAIAEFWADGPQSETPPGHWNTLANYTIDQLAKLEGEFKWKGSDALTRDEYELRTYLTMNGALHDAAVVAWGIKGFYEGNRPISVLRKLADMAEKDPAFAKELVSYSPNLKMVTYEAMEENYDSATGEPEYTSKGMRTKLAVYAWRGHPWLGQDVDGGDTDRRDFTFKKRSPLSREEDEFYSWDQGANGVGWILADNWMPYQQQNFVTPPFPGFVSGHSTFSRAAAEVLAYTTGSDFFPGGLGTYEAPELEFESSFDSKGFHFQWATFFDASDQSGVSRLYGGIHASYDDLPAREIGSKVGKEATKKAETIFKQ